MWYEYSKQYYANDGKPCIFYAYRPNTLKTAVDLKYTVSGQKEDPYNIRHSF